MADKTLIRKMLEQVDKGDASTLERHLSPRYVDHNPPPFPSLDPGLTGAQQAFSLALDAFTDFHHVIDDQVTEGNMVCTRIRAWGIHSGPFLGVPATNKKVQMAGIAFHRLNGKLLEHWGTIDALGLFQQLGVAPALPGDGPLGIFPEARQTPAKGAGKPDPEANKVLARRFLDEHDRQQGPAPELCAPGYTSYVTGRPTMDLQADRQMSSVFYRAFPDMQHHVEDLIAEGDKVAGRMTLQGTHRGDLMDIAQRARPLPSTRSLSRGRPAARSRKSGSSSTGSASCCSLA